MLFFFFFFFLGGGGGGVGGRYNLGSIVTHIAIGFPTALGYTGEQ